MEFLSQYGLFLLKTLTVVIALLVIFAGFFSMSRKPKPKLDITSLNEQYEHIHTIMSKEVLGEKIKKKKKDTDKKSNLYVIDFNGDIKASQVDQLRNEINALLTVVQPDDEVVVRIESPGGSVNGYGLAAAQLQRLREKKYSLNSLY